MNLKLAFLNVLRNKRRTILTVVSIVSGFFTIILVGGYYEYNYWGLRESMIRSQTAHIQVHKSGYMQNKEIDPFLYMIPNPEEIMNVIAKDSRTLITAKRLEYWGILHTIGGKDRVVNIRGIEPEKESLIFTFFTEKRGRELKSGSLGEVELGLSLAGKEGINIGDSVFITTITSQEEQNCDEYLVRGMVSSYLADFDEIMVNMTFEDAAYLADINGAQEIVILLQNTDLTAQFTKNLEMKFKSYGWDLEVSTWLDRSGYYKQVVGYYGVFYKIILFIVCIVSFFSSLNSLTMSTMERISEFGTMRSFGISRFNLLGILLLEALILGFFCSLIGSSISSVIVFIINTLGGIRLPAPPGMSTDIQVKILVTPALVLTGFGIAFVAPLFSLFVVGLKTLSMQIIEQIKFNELK